MTESNQATYELPADLLKGVYAVATGQLVHAYNGACPDQVEGAITRDDECPACLALMAADAALRASGVSLSNFVPSAKTRLPA